MRTVAIALSVLLMQSYPPPVPRDGARRLLESDRVIVWELQWPKALAQARLPTHQWIRAEIENFSVEHQEYLNHPDGARDKGRIAVVAGI